jgi:hypothetical protein
MADYPRSAVASDCRWDGRVDIDSSNASHHRHLDRKAVTDPNRAAVPIGSGLYRVVTPHLCAGFVVEDGRVTRCAPILRRKLAYWLTVGERVA